MSNDEQPEAAEWMRDAKCRGKDPATFFASNGSGVLVAQRLCATCPVTNECLEYALEHRIDFGVWGGASERQRRLMLRRRRAKLPAGRS